MRVVNVVQNYNSSVLQFNVSNRNALEIRLQLDSLKCEVIIALSKCVIVKNRVIVVGFARGSALLR